MDGWMDSFPLPSKAYLPTPIDSCTAPAIPPATRGYCLHLFNQCGVKRSSLSYRLRTPFVSVNGGSRLKPLNNSTTPPPSLSSSSSEDRQALDAVLRLYSAIKRKNISELSEIIGDECRCICHFIPFFRTFQGKEQVIAFFSCLMENLGHKFEFTVQPTLHDGMNIGVAWKLEWNKKYVPFGRGFSLHVCQIYQGRVTVSNVEMFLGPFLQFEPFKSNMVATSTMIAEGISRLVFSKKEAMKRSGYLVLVLLVTAVILLLLLK